MFVSLVEDPFWDTHVYLISSIFKTLESIVFDCVSYGLVSHSVWGMAIRPALFVLRCLIILVFSARDTAAR